MRGTWFVLAGLAGCGGDPDVTSSFEIVGHTDLGARGMSSAAAIAGDTIYVGSRVDQKPILILDTASLATVGEIPGTIGMSSRELRAAGDLLIVLNLRCSPDLHGCAMTGGVPENLELYDITNRRAPVLAATYPIMQTSPLFARGPHEFYVWHDASRTLVFLAAPGPSPQLEVIDVTAPAQPTLVVGWDPRMAGLMPKGGDDILHSVSLSGDGTRAYLSHQLSGLLVADVGSLPTVTLMTPPAAAYDWAPPGMGPHSAVEIPGTRVLVVTEEIYPMPYGGGCPWGHLRTVDATDPAAPKLLAELKIAENDPSLCATARERSAFTAHNATVTSEVALVTWYAGGIVAVDVRNPAKPKIVAELRPDPLPAVAVEDPGLGGDAVEMWSYPIIKDGLIYVVDVRNGLYVLRYTGVGEDTIASEAFLEGNSNL